MTNLLTLSDLLTRSVIVEAHEGVAIVLEVADRVLTQDVVADGIPDLRQIHISPEGRVDITGTVKTAEPVRRLGQLLQALLVQSSPPVQLRLVVSQATAPEPGYESVREYTDALAYFARPGRADSIRELYMRAIESLEVEQSGPAPTLDGIAPLPHADGSPRAATGKVSASSRRLMLVGAVAVLVLAGLVAGTYGRSGRLLQRQQQVSSAVVKASDAVGSALVSGVSAVTDRAGLGRLVPAAEETAAPARVEVPAGPPRTPRKRPGLGGGAPYYAVFDLDSAPEVAGGHQAFSASAGATVEDMAAAIRRLHGVVNGDSAVAESQLARGPGDVAAVGTIYFSGSHGVAPPVGVRPQLPKQLPSGVDPDTLGRIDLVIAEDGTVESVQLVGNQHTVRESMMLSAAKAWEFKPARKDGRPVRYRKTVWMAVE